MTVEPEGVREHLRGVLERSLGKTLGDTDDIFVDGGATSLFAMELVMLIERDFRIELEDGDLERTNFNTIEAMAGLVDRKTND